MLRQADGLLQDSVQWSEGRPVAIRPGSIGTRPQGTPLLSPVCRHVPQSWGAWQTTQDQSSLLLQSPPIEARHITSSYLSSPSPCIKYVLLAPHNIQSRQSLRALLVSADRTYRGATHGAQCVLPGGDPKPSFECGWQRSSHCREAQQPVWTAAFIRSEEQH